jgi:hypothetical protein
LPASSTAAQNNEDGHDTELGKPLDCSILTGSFHELPLNVEARPPIAVTMHNDSGEHDNDKSWSKPMPDSTLHELPLYVEKPPPKLTATQNDAEEHDTATVSPLPMRTGALHEAPLKIIAFPRKSTAAQNDDDEHDTDSR